VELERYDNDTLAKRRKVADQYSWILSAYDWAELPVLRKENISTCYHLYPLRIKGITETQRDQIIQHIFDQDVSVNVHFIPVPMMSFYRNAGYDINNYPTTYDNFSREISLPIFYDITEDQVKQVVQAVVIAVHHVIGTGLA
jgi:dTDP-4-amino-4,6-dideoxygalactose transaminase